MSGVKNASSELKVATNDQRRKEIGQERRERTRAKLLAAAAQVLAEHGEMKATIDDFIQAAGVARGTFYNYYQTRGQLMDDLWAELGRDPFNGIQEACVSIEDPAERLATKTRLILQTAKENSTWGWVVFALSRDITTVNTDLLAFPRPELEEGLRAGRFKFDGFDAAKDLVVGTCRTALHALLIEERPVGYPQSISTLILRSLGVSLSEARALAKLPLPSVTLTPCS
jgi:AcrR family transcriptional regulator